MWHYFSLRKSSREVILNKFKIGSTKYIYKTYYVSTESFKWFRLIMSTVDILHKSAVMEKWFINSSKNHFWASKNISYWACFIINIKHRKINVWRYNSIFRLDAHFVTTNFKITGLLKFISHTKLTRVYV